MGKIIKSIFITGATGFIGNNVVKKLIDTLGEGSVLYILTRKQNKFEDPRVVTLFGDLREIEKFADQLNNSNYIIHLAAEAGYSDNVDYDAVNFLPVQNIISILKKSNKLEDFIYVSTIGAVDRKSDEKISGPITVKSVPCPTTKYGQSKLKSEECLRESKLPFTIIRPTWVYGKNMRTRSHINQFVTWVYESNPLINFSFPGRVSMIHVEDLASAIVACIGNTKVIGMTYIAETESYSIGQIFSFIYESINGKKPFQIFVPKFNFIFKHLHKFFPLIVNNLFVDYLFAQDEAFKKDLLLETKNLFERSIFDVISTNICNAGYWVITGANSGIGHDLAIRMNSAGKKLILVDKDISEIIKLGNHRVIQCDLSNENELSELVEDIVEYRIFGLINNAGVGFRGNFDKVDLEKHISTIKVDILAPVFLTRKLLPILIQNNGFVVNIISSSSEMILPGMASYAAAKAFLLSWSSALWWELKNKCHVITFSPSGTNTNFQKMAGVKESQNLLSSEYVAGQIYRSIKKRKHFVFLGLRSKILTFCIKFLPRKFEVIVWSLLFNKSR